MKSLLIVLCKLVIKMPYKKRIENVNRTGILAADEEWSNGIKFVESVCLFRKDASMKGMERKSDSIIGIPGKWAKNKERVKEALERWLIERFVHF